MTTAAVDQETIDPQGPPAESGETAEVQATVAGDAPATVAELIWGNDPELRDEFAGAGVEIDRDTDIATLERSKLFALANSLFKRLAGDEAEITDIAAAAKIEVELITSRYQAQAAKVSRAVSWKRFSLETIAAILFPSADAKKKSVNLPYGTLGRKDYAPAPELVDEAAVLQRCFADSRRDLIKLNISTTAEEMEDVLVGAFRRVFKDGEASRETLTQSVRDEIDLLIARSDRAEPGAPRVKLALAWGDLKKEPAVQLFTIARSDSAPGVTMTKGSTKFYAEVLEG